MQTAVTIGNFDGCHGGHQALIRAVNSLKGSGISRSVAMSFSPRPEEFFRCSGHTDSLFTDTQKVRALKELGVDEVIIERFDHQFAQVTHQYFFEEILIKKLRATAICIGSDFCFGYKRLGDAKWLQAQSESSRVRVIICPPVLARSEPISSTRVRRAIADDGNVAYAAEMLTRPYMLEGMIERGDQLGRTIGFPTANLGHIQQILPKFGVYQGFVWTSSDVTRNPPIMGLPPDAQPAVINIGIRPTLATATPQIRVEAHILAKNIGVDSLYGHKAAFYFGARLRDELKFLSLQALQAQIAEDVERAQIIGPSITGFYSR